MQKESIQKFLEVNKDILLALSIFLLITLELKNSETKFSDPLALTSAILAYILMISIIRNLKKSDDILTTIFIIVLPIFVISFCMWFLFNLYELGTGVIILTIAGLIILPLKIGIDLFIKK